MSVLESIRKRSALVIILIGFAMIAFLLGDFFKSGSSSGSDLFIAKIAGEPVPYAAFNDRVVKYTDFYKKNGNPNISQGEVVALVWKEYINQVILQQEAKKAGIRIGAKELWSIVSKQPSFQNNDYFKGNDGRFDPSKLAEYIEALKDRSQNSERDALVWQQWLQDEQIYKYQALLKNYTNLVFSGMNQTDLEKSSSKELASERADIDFVVYRYKNYPTPEVSDESIQQYIENHPEKYKREASRDLQYVSLDILPSTEDDAEFLSEITTLLSERILFNKITSDYDTVLGFKQTKENVLFVNENSDLPFDSKYYHRNALKNPVVDFAFGATIGDVLGPIKQGNQYRLIKLVDKKVMPDSVKASHIFVGFSATGRQSTGNRTKDQAKKLADSLYTILIKKPNEFDAFVQVFSDDTQTKNDGGALPWVTYGQMSPEMNQFAFFGRRGTLKNIESPVGYHIVRIDKQTNKAPAVQLATVYRQVIASETTENAVYSKARKILSKSQMSLEEFSSTAKDEGAVVRTVQGLKINDFDVQGLGNRRDLVKWAFDPNTKFKSAKLFNSENGYVVAILTFLSEKGLASIDEVGNEVRSTLIKEEQAKGMVSEILGTKMNNLKSLAQKLNMEEPQENLSVNAQTPVLTGVGNEPDVIYPLLFGKQEVLSKPLTGKAGVFVGLTKKKYTADQNANYNIINQIQQQQTIQYRKSQFQNMTRESFEIKDYRFKFY